MLARMNISRPHLVTTCWILVILALGVPLYLFEPSQSVLGDFTVYYEAALRVRNSQNLYDHSYSIKVADGRLFTLYYFYPPFLAHWLSSVAGLPFEQVQLLWTSLSFASLLVAAWGLSDIFQKLRPGALSPETSLCLALSLLLCFEPTYWGIKEGQVNAIILALITTHIALFMRGKDQLAGGVLAIAALLKMSPALLILLPLRLCRWRVLVGFLGTTLFAVLLLLATTPMSVFKDFFLPFGPLLAGTLERHYFFNFAFDKAVLQLFGLDDFAALRWTAKLILGLLPILAVTLLGKRNQGSAHTLILYGILISCMILLAPTLWAHHLVWTIIPLCVLSGRIFPTKDERLRHMTLTLGMFVLFAQTLLIQLHSCRAVFPGRCNPNVPGAQEAFTGASSAPELLLHLTTAVPGMLLLALIVLLWRSGRSSPS